MGLQKKEDLWIEVNRGSLDTCLDGLHAWQRWRGNHSSELQAAEGGGATGEAPAPAQAAAGPATSTQRF